MSIELVKLKWVTEGYQHYVDLDSNTTKSVPNKVLMYCTAELDIGEHGLISYGWSEWKKVPEEIQTHDHGKMAIPGVLPP